MTQLPHIPKVGSGAHRHPAPGTCAPQMPASREALRRLTPSSAAPSRQARRPWAAGYPVLETGLFFIRIQNPSRSPEALHSARARSLASPSLVPREGLMLKSRTHGCRRSRLINANPCPKAQAVRPPPERTVPVILNGGEPRGGRSRTASQTHGGSAAGAPRGSPSPWAVPAPVSDGPRRHGHRRGQPGKASPVVPPARSPLLRTSRRWLFKT